MDKKTKSITAFTNVLVGELKSAGVTGVITTNAPGGSWNKALDHNDLFEQMDMPAFDNYPVWGGSTSAPQASTVALTLDTARGWRKTMNNNNDQASSTSNDGTGWMVAEQLIGAQGHDIIGFTPRPQQAVAWSAAALLGHGATALLFFRFRPALFGQVGW
jgi:beta-galactosidase